MRPPLLFTLFALAACEGAIVLPTPLTGPDGVTPAPGPDAPPPCTAAELAEPGRVTMRRLNRFEYDATVRDLLGDVTHPAKDFPADDFGRGYDNLGEVLSTSPLLVEKWQVAAEKLTTALLDAEVVAGQSTRVAADTMTASTGVAEAGGGWNLFSNGTLSTTVSFVTTGTFTLRVNAYEQHAGPDFARMRLLLDGVNLLEVDVPATAAAPGTYSVQRSVTQGSHTVGVEFLNDYYQPPADRNLVVAFVEVQKPGSVTSPANAKLLTCDPASGDACIREVLARFARKAWRRPISTAEGDKLAAFVTLAKSEGDDVRTGLSLAVQAILLSPNFVYRPELGISAQITALSPHQLATRLSYFLWGSMPDDELAQLADDGTLVARLEPQVKRMLADPKASALVSQFAGSWLWSRAVADKTNLAPALKDAEQQEVQRFFEVFLTEDRSALELLGADFTFVNDALAGHYGLPAPMSTSLKRVTVDGTQRGSLLGHGAMLTVTSHDYRTAPVKRGKWVLSQLLCAEPPPPPPGIPAFMPVDTGATKSLREQMEAHRTNPMCAACHASMDPLGFGLENYDHQGRWRTTDEAGFAIDSSGKLPDGRTFDGPQQLAALLHDDARFPRCLSEQLFIFGLGRDVTHQDRCGVDALAQTFAAKGHRLPELIGALVQSPAFTMRRGEAP